MSFTILTTLPHYPFTYRLVHDRYHTHHRYTTLIKHCFVGHITSPTSLRSSVYQSRLSESLLPEMSTQHSRTYGEVTFSPDRVRRTPEQAGETLFYAFMGQDLTCETPNRNRSIRLFKGDKWECELCKEDGESWFHCLRVEPPDNCCVDLPAPLDADLRSIVSIVPFSAYKESEWGTANEQRQVDCHVRASVKSGTNFRLECYPRRRRAIQDRFHVVYPPKSAQYSFEPSFRIPKQGDLITFTRSDDQPYTYNAPDVRPGETFRPYSTSGSVQSTVSPNQASPDEIAAIADTIVRSMEDQCKSCGFVHNLASRCLTDLE